eukprot:scaffold29802_cov46-Prasinocladus_malaysianus.AAC.1
MADTGPRRARGHRQSLLDGCCMLACDFGRRQAQREGNCRRQHLKPIHRGPCAQHRGSCVQGCSQQSPCAVQYSASWLRSQGQKVRGHYRPVCSQPAQESLLPALAAVQNDTGNSRQAFGIDVDLPEQIRYLGTWQLEGDKG